jgi:hypothetical protein
MSDHEDNQHTEAAVETYVQAEQQPAAINLLSEHLAEVINEKAQ